MPAGHEVTSPGGSPVFFTDPSATIQLKIIVEEKFHMRYNPVSAKG